MALLTLNIGLVAQGRPYPAERALAALRAAGAVVSMSTVVQSDTEPTLVVVCDVNPYMIQGVSMALDQDCIAVWNGETRQGWLSGPRADAWGDFNPDLFFVPNGKRLSDVLAAVLPAPRSQPEQEARL